MIQTKQVLITRIIRMKDQHTFNPTHIGQLLILILTKLISLQTEGKLFPKWDGGKKLFPLSSIKTSPFFYLN